MSSRLRDTPLNENSLADVNIFSGDDSGTSFFALGDKTQKVTGLSKLVSIYLKKLFTTRGTNPVDLTEGTTFSELLGYSMGGEEEILVRLQEELQAAEDQVIADQVHQNLPDNERLASATLLDIEFTTQDHVIVYVDLVSVAGPNVQLKLPEVT